MFPTNLEDGVQPLLAVTSTAATSGKSLGFRQLVLSVRFVICLRKTRSLRPPPVSRTASSRSYTAVEIHSEEDEGEIEKQELKRIVKCKDLGALQKFGGVERALSLLCSESGPHPQDTENYGLERMPVHEARLWDLFFLSSKGFWSTSWKSFNSYTIFLLIIAAGVSLANGSLQSGVKYGWHDSVGILLAVFLLVFFPSVLAFYRKRAEEIEFLKTRSKLEVSVKRDGKIQLVSVSDVKEGEIIHLKKGDRVPADGLLRKGKNLILDEVINCNIDPDQNPFLFSGSVVKHGEGVMIAISTGADTALGKGLLDVAVHPSQETLLQSQINKPYQFIEMFALVVYIVILLVTLIRFKCGKGDDYDNDKPETKVEVTMSLMENVFRRTFLKSRQGVSLLTTVLVTVVIGIQHAMPFAFTISLSLWREKIRRSYGGKCHNLSACGTLGLVSAICIDITGELSFHEVEVEELLIGEEKINPGEKFHPDILEGLEQAIRVIEFDSLASVQLGKNLLSSWESSDLRMSLESVHEKFKIIDHKILSSRKGIGALMRRTGDDTEANLHLHYNGDASTILNMCSQYYDITGTSHDIENKRDVFKKVISDMKEKGFKPIAFACKQTDGPVFEGGMKLLGFVGLKYSCQKLKMALMDLNDGGVRIILTSEDELSVITSMAVALGIQCGSNNQVIEGEKFREIMERAVIGKNELMQSITVLGKATLEDKLLLLEELKTAGHVVAFLGGLSTSDAPTLRGADVGITLENQSTEASRTTSDIIIAAPTSLNKIIRCGRCSCLNIQKFYLVLLTASISGLLIVMICTMVSGKSPITTSHLLWVTLIMCVLGSLMMVMELNDEEVQIPLGSNRNQSLITRVILKKIAIHVLSQVLLFLSFEYLGEKIVPHMEEDLRHTMVFNSFILWQICNLFSVMGLVTKGIVVLKAVLQSHWFVIFLVGVLTVQVLVIQFAGSIVNGVKLNVLQWAICFFSASLRLTLKWIILN